LIDKHRIKYFIQINPTPLKIKAQLKIHTQDIPMRPVVYIINLQAIKITKFLSITLNNVLNLLKTYMVSNSTILANILRLQNKEEYRLLTLDIKSLDVNIPIN